MVVQMPSPNYSEQELRGGNALNLNIFNQVYETSSLKDDLPKSSAHQPHGKSQDPRRESASDAQPQANVQRQRRNSVDAPTTGRDKEDRAHGLINGSRK